VKSLKKVKTSEKFFGSLKVRKFGITTATLDLTLVS